MYRMYRETLQEKNSVLWLPAVSSFQLDRDIDEFESDFYRTVIQTLIAHSEDISSARLGSLNLEQIKRWLNSPEYKTRTLGVGASIISGNMGIGRQANSTKGFEESGFPVFVRNLMTEIFRGGQRGGIICVLDNLEIVKKSGDARDGLDALRDRLFNIPEVRWVLCGARGVLARARTPRLSGIFMAPENVPPLLDDEVAGAIRLRIEEFGSEKMKIPLAPENFEFIYTILNRNLRDSMSWSQSFAHWLIDEYPELDFPHSVTEMKEVLVDWLAGRARESYEQIKDVRPRSWSYFTDLCNAGGIGYVDEYRKFKFGRRDALNRSMSELLDANLTVKEVDPEDPNREMHTVTAAGYLLDFYHNALGIPDGKIDDISL